MEAAASQFMSSGHGNANYIATRYKNHMIESRLAPSTVNRRLASLRFMVRLAKTFGMVSWDVEVSNMKSERYRDTAGPGIPTFSRMLQVAARQRNSVKAKQDVAILRLFFDLALRRQELLDMDAEDVDFENRRIQILGKGRTEKQLLNAPESTMAALSEWMKVRGTLECEALFVNFSHCHAPERLSPQGLYKLIVTLGKKAGTKVRPHGIRYTSITQALTVAQESGLEIETVMSFSRHRDIKTVLVYRDAVRDHQGSIANMVAGSVG